MITNTDVKTMSWSQAHKVLGVKVGSSEEQVKKAYKDAAKKLHPDVGGDPDEFVKLNNAYKLIQGGKAARRDGLNLKDVLKEYRLLRRRVGMDTLDEGRLQEAEIELVKSKDYRDDPEAAKRLEYASNILREQIRGQRSIQDRASSKFRSRAARALATQEMRKNRIEDEKMQKMTFHLGLSEAKSNINEALRKVAERAKIIGRKVHIPVIQRENGKKVVRYVVITAGILGAIAAGKWAYDSANGAFRAPTKPKLLEIKTK